MFKSLIYITIIFAFLQFATPNIASAQTNNTAVGVRLDFGRGSSYFGFSAKHFFTPKGAGEAYFLFANRSSLLGVEYQHHFNINRTQGLRWYLGFGPAINFYRFGGADLWIRPVLGLEYKFPGSPINMGFDWRPIIFTDDDGGFEPGRFGFAARYVF